MAAEGDERGASLFDHYHPRLYRCALAKLGSHAVADEVAAEVFAPALRDLDRFRWRGGGFEAWIGFSGPGSGDDSSGPGDSSGAGIGRR
jgi:DNA-directed RNA polymerase specialized sigma24 family protein